MRDLNKSALLLLLLLLLGVGAIGCRPDPQTHFELNGIEVSTQTAVKDRLKSPEQWVSIVYTNLFQAALPANELFDVSQVFSSIGDQEIAREVLLSNFFNSDEVQLPTPEEMQANPDAFIDATYLRFFVRLPTAAERTYVRNFLDNHPGITPELVYMSFALSEEYLYY
jgi:hypothetical protein